MALVPLPGLAPTCTDPAVCGPAYFPASAAAFPAGTVKTWIVLDSCIMWVVQSCNPYLCVLEGFDCMEDGGHSPLPNLSLFRWYYFLLLPETGIFHSEGGAGFWGPLYYVVSQFLFSMSQSPDSSLLQGILLLVPSWGVCVQIQYPLGPWALPFCVHHSGFKCHLKYWPLEIPCFSLQFICVFHFGELRFTQHYWA